MSESTLIFELPLPENRGGNSRGHWSSTYRRRKAYWERLDNLVLLQRIPRAPERPWAAAVATIEMRTFRQTDEDNAHARLKDPLDWLQSRGYVVNDREVRLRVTPRTAPRTACGITLTLERAG